MYTLRAVGRGASCTHANSLRSDTSSWRARPPAKSEPHRVMRARAVRRRICYSAVCSILLRSLLAYRLSQFLTKSVSSILQMKLFLFDPRRLPLNHFKQARRLTAYRLRSWRHFLPRAVNVSMKQLIGIEGHTSYSKRPPLFCIYQAQHHAFYTTYSYFSFA